MADRIQKYNFKEGLPQEFEIVNLKELFISHHKDLTTTHRAEFYQIIWFQKGGHIHLVDFNPIEIKPNTVLFLNKNVVQRFDSNNKVEGKSILFTDNFFSKSESDFTFLKSSILFNDLLTVSQFQLSNSSFVFTELVKQMEDELVHLKDNFQTDILRNTLHSFLLQSERERRNQNFTEVKKGEHLDYVIQFKDLIEQHFKHQKFVSNYASQIHITEKKLNQSTSKILGKTPKKMIDERIMLEAKRLLSHTNESAKEIGYELGFDEPTNFVKYFKKHEQSTPLEFRVNSNS